MSKVVTCFLMSLGTLIMDYKKIFFILILFFNTSSIFAEVVYKKDNLVITNIDVRIYKQLYENNYGSKIDNNNALKDLVLINNLISDIEKNNKEFLDQIDSQILLQYGEKTLNNNNFRNFLRFSKVRDEFIINYFNNKLTVEEVLGEFQKLESLLLPISKDNCIIIDKLVDLKNKRDFVEILLQNLKNNKKDFEIVLDKIQYEICIDEDSLRSLELLIVKYIESRTNEDFRYFVYGKTKN